MLITSDNPASLRKMLLVREQEHIIREIQNTFVPIDRLWLILESEIKMSKASKATLAMTGLGTAGIVWFVHWAQEQERAVCFLSFFL